MKALLREYPALYAAATGAYMRLLVLGARLGLVKLPDANSYAPLLLADRCDRFFAETYERVGSRTLLGREKLYLLYQFLRETLSCEGEVWECGVYRGGSALMFHALLNRAPSPPHQLRLFDSFAGLPATTGADLHRQGDLQDTSLADVQALFPSPAPVIHAGWIPETFRGLEHCQIAFAHVDVDLYQSVLDCCAFIYPRLNPGGVIVFDDYGFPTCPGARRAVDEFFAQHPEKPVVFSTGQAAIFKK